MVIEHVNSDRYLVPLEGFTHAVTVDIAGARWIFVSGLTSRDDGGEVQDIADVAGQTRRILSSLQAILAKAGAGLGDVVRLVTYFADIEDHSAFADVRGEFFGSRLPAETSVEVSRLFDPRQLIEIEATAVVA